jgi:formate hydrogenlyase subunit 3/multisubunit Na+/H+ antiporter MnhD subunit
VIGLVLRADQIGAAAGIIAAVAGVVAAVFAIRGCRATNRNAAVQLGNWRSEIRPDLSATAFFRQVRGSRH